MTATDALIQTARSEIPGFGGSFTTPEDPGYEQARAVYNAMIDRRPALIARAAERRKESRGAHFRSDATPQTEPALHSTSRWDELAEARDR